MAVRSYVEPSTTKDWHKLDVKHVSLVLLCLCLRVANAWGSKAQGTKEQLTGCSSHKA